MMKLSAGLLPRIRALRAFDAAGRAASGLPEDERVVIACGGAGDHREDLR